MKRTGRRLRRELARQEQSLSGTDASLAAESTGRNAPCDVVAIEKRRNGSTRYWCRTHRADATAKYGKPASKCRGADLVGIRPEDVKLLDLGSYPGGVALWGAAPAVYDTTRLPFKGGIHVHARPATSSDKEIDSTYQAVRIIARALPAEGVVVGQIDAIYYLVSSVFGLSMRFVSCTHCRRPHLDTDWFSVHPHRRHLCAGCGRYFHDRAAGIGNPIMGVRDACGASKQHVALAAKTLSLKQSDYPGGIQIWGSSPAFLWTQSKHEEEGVHIHAFLTESPGAPTIDDTFAEVVIDGVRLDPVMVRVLMAQNLLPSLTDRVRSMTCPACGHSQFDTGEAAYVPSPTHICSKCLHQFAFPGKKRNAVANPLPGILTGLARLAPRPPQQHRIDLLPETL